MDESEVRFLEQPKVGVLKLSGAMRAGARLRPQTKGWCFHQGASCAIGAMYEGMTGDSKEESSLMCDLPPSWWQQIRATLPHDVIDEIWMRNDNGVPREQIADWLAAQGY